MDNPNDQLPGRARLGVTLFPKPSLLFPSLLLAVPCPPRAPAQPRMKLGAGADPSGGTASERPSLGSTLKRPNSPAVATSPPKQSPRSTGSSYSHSRPNSLPAPRQRRCHYRRDAGTEPPPNHADASKASPEPGALPSPAPVPAAPPAPTQPRGRRPTQEALPSRMGNFSRPDGEGAASQLPSEGEASGLSLQVHLGFGSVRGAQAELCRSSALLRAPRSCRPPPTASPRP